MIVFDSSTIILLAKIELLDTILQSYKKGCLIPEGVKREVTQKDSFDAMVIKKRLEEGKIKIKGVSREKIGKLMNDFNLDKSEAEAIILALAHPGSLLATDDKNAINACKLLNLPFTTSLDILIRAKEKKLLTPKDAEHKLQELAGYGRYKKELIEDAKKRVRGKIKCKPH